MVMVQRKLYWWRIKSKGFPPVNSGCFLLGVTECLRVGEPGCNQEACLYRVSLKTSGKEGNLYLPGSNISLAFLFLFKMSTLSPNFEFVNYLLYISVSCSLGLQLARLLCLWDSPGKNTGVGCHFLLQGIFLAQESNSGFFWTTKIGSKPCKLQICHLENTI